MKTSLLQRPIAALVGFCICGFAAAPLAVADSVVLTLSGALGSSSVNGISLGAGTYTAQQLEDAGSVVGVIGSGGVASIPLWGLLGGNAAGTASDVVTDSSKNAILRYYLLATTKGGFQSIISLGEFDPFFGGTSAGSPFLSFSQTDTSPALIFPGFNAGGRDLTGITSLQVLSAPALPVGPGGVSTSLLLSGNVTRPGVYSQTDLMSFAPVTETVKGDTYTGVPLWTLLSPNSADVFNQYVIAGGTDGYEVLFSLAELDPSLGASGDLVPYADTAGQFPSNGFARIVIPGDNHAGRYVSNLDLLQVTAIPEPGTLVLFGTVFAAVFLWLVRIRHGVVRMLLSSEPDGIARQP